MKLHLDLLKNAYQSVIKKCKTSHFRKMQTYKTFFPQKTFSGRDLYGISAVHNEAIGRRYMYIQQDIGSVNNCITNHFITTLLGLYTIQTTYGKFIYFFSNFVFIPISV